MQYLWVGIGGFLGANARFVLARAFADRFGGAFPYGTLVVNLSGSLLIGVILSLIAERIVPDEPWRWLVAAGFLGGYTTFSSYSWETVKLLEAGRWERALLYVVASNGLGLLACAIGIIAARAVAR